MLFLIFFSQNGGAVQTGARVPFLDLVQPEMLYLLPVQHICLHLQEKHDG